jgi:CHASE2 domain-containing sensor protein
METHKVNEDVTQRDQAASRPNSKAVSTFGLRDCLMKTARKILEKLRSAVRSSSPRTVVLVTSLVASLLVFGLANMRFFNLFRLDNWVESWSIRYMRDHVVEDRVDSKDIKIVLISATQHGEAPWGDINKKHREFFGELVRAMKKAQAKVLAFDIAFDGNSSFDADFGNAIAEAEKNGLRVVVGVDKYEHGRTDPEIPEKLREPVQNRWGTILVGGSQGSDRPIRTLKLATPDLSNNPSGNTGGEQPVIPSLALRVVMESQNPPLKPFLIQNEKRLVLRTGGGGAGILKSIPLEREVDLLIDQASQDELRNVRVDAQQVYDELNSEDALKAYKDRLVLVGYEFNDSRPILSGGERLGVELHATVISNIIHNVFIFKLLPIYNYLVILSIAFVVALLYRPVGKRLEIPIKIPGTEFIVKIPGALFLISAAYVVIAFLVYKETKVYLDVCYHVTAVFLTYYLVWFVLKWRFPSQT